MDIYPTLTIVLKAFGELNKLLLAKCAVLSSEKQSIDLYYFHGQL